jgi:Flp pilus assembly protein TadD
MVDDSAVDAIVAALRAGDPSLAERRCRAALERWPDAPKLLFPLAYALRQQGRARDALEIFARLVELCPEDGTHWGNYAAALEAVGDLAAAVDAAETAVRCAPDAAQPLEQLGLLQWRRGELVAARDTLLRAHALAPASASVCLHAARVCVACRDQRANDMLRGWRDWPPLADAQQRVLANLLVQVGGPQDALNLLEALVLRDPADWTSALLLAKVYERVNRPDVAHAQLAWVADHAPADDAAITHEVQAQSAQLAMRKHDYATARSLLERAGAWGEDDDGHFFALATACDRLGDAAAAMRALATAHALQIGDLRASNPDLLEPGAPWLPHAGELVTAADHRAWPELRAPDADQSPVFVVGFPRSGTTLLEQMLDAHPRLQSMDERPFLNRLAAQLQDIGIEVPGDLRRLNQRDCDELRKGYVLMACGKVTRSWDTRLVDKNPLNMLWLPLLHRLFPRAKIILVLRHPCDVTLSCYLQNFRAAPLVAACRSLEYLAHAYVAAMENWLYHAALFQPDVFVSRYEDLVAAPASQVERIAAFLGLDDAAAMLRFAARAREKGFIRTPSYSKVTEPIDPRAAGRWQRYREYFESVLPILRPMLEHWNYSARPAAAPPESKHGNQ